MRKRPPAGGNPADEPEVLPAPTYGPAGGFRRPARVVDERVRDYYERNTARWIGSRVRSRHGPPPSPLALHRKLWGPGVSDGEAALRHVHSVVSDVLAAYLEAPAVRSNRLRAAADSSPERETRILDMGCGVGGPAFALARRFRARVTGISISALQVAIAGEAAERLGLSGQCEFVTGDFHAPPPLGTFDCTIAIESFAHARAPELFFEAAARLTAPGGLLVLCDDFLCDPPDDEGERARSRRWVLRFERRWRLGTLLSPAETRRLAERAGFRTESERDLTPLVRTGRLLTLLGTPLGLFPARSAFWGNLSGGAACRRCIASGYTSYRLVAFRKARKPMEG